MTGAALLNGLPSNIGTLSPTETAEIEALCLAPVAENPHGSNQVQILIGTPTLGLVHIQWYNAMQGMVTPPNWATVRSTPTGFDVATAQNILVDSVLRGPFRALLLIEDDTCPPPQTLIEMDRWYWKMERKLAPPVVSGVYHLKGSAEVRTGKKGGIELLGPEPLIYRDGGTRAYRDGWTYGDVVWCSGVPTGALLIHRDLLEAWAKEPDLETFTVAGYPHPLKRIFQNPSKVWTDPGSGSVFATAGTSDLWWCTETTRRGLMAKAGWPALARKKYQFICDTALRFGHVDRSTGTIY